MARKRQAAVDDTDAILSFLGEQARKRALTHGYDTAREIIAADIGIRLPYLCHRYMLQRNTYPLERVTLVFGPPKSNKSAFMFWLFDLFTNPRYGTIKYGRYFHMETEGKDTAEMRFALTGYRDEVGDSFACSSMDQFQTQTKETVEWYKDVIVKNEKVGSRLPLIMGIDSLTASMTGDAQNVMAKNDGVAGRRFADEARSLSDWFKVVPGYLQGYPLSLVGITHDKPVKDPRTGIVTHRAPGGESPTYAATYKILMQKVAGIPQGKSGWAGNRIKFSLHASALGVDKLGFEAEIGFRKALRKNADGESILVQEAGWNWHKASIELLANLGSQVKNCGARNEAVKDILGPISKQTGGKFSCVKLGVSPSEAMPATQLGEILESRVDILSQLEPALGITYGRVFDQSMEYVDQVALAKKESHKLTPIAEVETADSVVDDTSTPNESASEEE